MRNFRVVGDILRGLVIFALFGPLASADDWPQWLGPERDGVWRETGVVNEFPPAGPPVRWRTPIGAGFSGPAVVGDRVYVTDRVLASGAKNPDNPFARDTVAGSERILCLDANDGQILWTHEYECDYTVSYGSGPRTTPIVTGGKVYALGAEGDLFCLDAADGTVQWSRELKKDYHTNSPIWGFSASPLLDGNRLICIVGGSGSVAVAFDKDSGKEIWHALSAAEPGYCPPVIYDYAGRRQLIIWHPQAVNGLNPETGEVYWSIPSDVKAGMTIATPRKLGNLLFVSSFYDGPLMLEFVDGESEPRLLWRGESHSERNTDKLHCVMSTPTLTEGYIYGVGSYGQLRCLNVDTGQRIWADLQATGSTGDIHSGTDRWKNAFLIRHEDRFFLANETGDLIIAKITPAGYDEISRAHLLEPTNPMPGREVVWAHPAFADRCTYMRNDKEIICVDLEKR